MTMTKVTQKQALRVAIDAINVIKASDEPIHVDLDAVLEKLESMVQNLENKPKQNKGAAENALANEAHKEKIIAFLANGSKYTASEILAGIPSFKENNFSNQRVSYLLRSLKTDGKVDKCAEKGKTMFYMI